MEDVYMGDHICPWWFAYTFDNPFRRFFHNPEKMLGSYVSRGMTVLDVGCGMGFFSIGLGLDIFEPLRIDFSAISSKVAALNFSSQAPPSCLHVIVFIVLSPLNRFGS